MTNTLSERAMLARLSIGMWTAKKYDRKVTKEINDAKGAAADAGRYNKRLLAKDALSAIATISGQARDTWRARTVPWFDDGSRILSTLGHAAFAEEMRKLREAWDVKVNSFCSAYPTLVEEAEGQLNGLFNAADYPDPSIIHSKFAFEVRFLPVPQADDFRAQVSDDQAKMIRDDIERSINEVMTSAVQHSYERITKVVQHMSERLTEYKPSKGNKPAEGVFRDSLVENVRELVGLLPSLNIMNDPHLDEIARRMSRELCRNDASILRDSERIRNEVTASAAAILADVSDYI